MQGSLAMRSNPEPRFGVLASRQGHRLLGIPYNGFWMELGQQTREDSTKRKQRKKEEDLRRSQHLGHENASEHLKVDICRLPMYAQVMIKITAGLLIWYSDADLTPIYSAMYVPNKSQFSVDIKVRTLRPDWHVQISKDVQGPHVQIRESIMSKVGQRSQAVMRNYGPLPWDRLNLMRDVWIVMQFGIGRRDTWTWDENGWKWMKMDEMGMRCRRADELVGSRQQELAGLKGEEVLKLKSVILPHNCGRYLHSHFRTTLENFPRWCLLFPTWGAWCELTGRREAVGVCAPGLFELHRTVKLTRFEHAKLRLMKELGVSAPQYWSQDQQTWKVHEHSSRSVMSVHYDT